MSEAWSTPGRVESYASAGAPIRSDGHPPTTQLRLL